MDGFSAIGLVRPKCAENIGSVLRAAHCYNASMVAIENCRTKVVACTDTPKAYARIPVLRVDNLRNIIPFNCAPVAVDLVDDAIELPDFVHPKQAFYIFGPEDGTLGKSVLEWCAYRVMIPTRNCMNLAATVNVVLYDRLAKELAKQREKMTGEAA